MSRRSRALGVALAASLAVAGCGGAAREVAGRGLEQDTDLARKALGGSSAASFVLRVVDGPDGALRTAMTSGDDAMTAEQARALLGAQLRLVVDPNGDRTLDDAAAATGSEEELRAYDMSFAVRSADGTLVELRVADGDLYLGTDYAAVRKAAALGGGEAALDGALAAAPAELAQVVTDLKAGKWLRVPAADLLEQARAAGLAPTATPDPLRLIPELQAAIRPNVRLRDLREDDGVREVRVEVDVKKALGGVVDAFRRQPGFPPLPTQEGLGGVSPVTVSAVLRIEDGHFTRLTVPLAGLLALDASPDPDAPAVGASALVIDIDDSADEVTAPAQVSSFDVAAAVEPLLAGVAGGALGGGLQQP